MSAVLDGLKERLDSAKVRLANAQQRHQAASVELNAATAEHNIWTAALQIETREEAQRAAAAQQNQISMELPATIPESASVPVAEEHFENEAGTDPVNKTELVREALRQHATGMTPTEVWKSLQKHFSSRAYLYSILKRLRDKDEVVLRRSGKYVLKIKQLDLKGQIEAAEQADRAAVNLK